MQVVDNITVSPLDAHVTIVQIYLDIRVLPWANPAYASVALEVLDCPSDVLIASAPVTTKKSKP